MKFSTIHGLVSVCAAKGIRHAVLCPGSRSAPLTLAFARNKKIRSRTFSDERSAAFIAMGMAQSTRVPVALVCTSGSAAYNFAPAVAEAFFQQIPLIVFTADRPPEWIDQFDGQTIRQKELYGHHVKKYFELPVDYAHPDAVWHANRIINEAINLSMSGQPGPVHINVPFREPLYDTTVQENGQSRILISLPATASLSRADVDLLVAQLATFRKILLVSGQNDHDQALEKVLSELHRSHAWPVAGDILGNLHGLPFFCRHADTFLGGIAESDEASLRPDLLITFGKSLIAKNLKLHLRKHPPREHWHLQAAGEVADTFQSLTKIVPVSPSHFFRLIKKDLQPSQKSQKDFARSWQDYEQGASDKVDRFFRKETKGEFKIVKKVIDSLPSGCRLHLANSMAVRYANHIGLRENQQQVHVFANRGTSGIDGCSSTAVGHTLTSPNPNVLITGDLAFFYDRNAFWHNYALPNLFVVVLNNHGGLIFNLIDGPAGLAERDEFFITRQKLTARALAAEFGLSFHDAVATDLKDFFISGGQARILEIDSTQAYNKEVFERFKRKK